MTYPLKESTLFQLTKEGEQDPSLTRIDSYTNIGRLMKILVQQTTLNLRISAFTDELVSNLTNQMLFDFKFLLIDSLIFNLIKSKKTNHHESIFESIL